MCNINMFPGILHSGKCHNLPCPFYAVPHPITCFLVYLSYISFDENKQIYVCCLILPFVIPKIAYHKYLTLLFALTTSWKSRHTSSQSSFSFFITASWYCIIYVLQFIQPIFYAWTSRQFPIFTVSNSAAPCTCVFTLLKLRLQGTHLEMRVLA